MKELLMGLWLLGLLLIAAAPIEALASRPHRQRLLAFDVWTPTRAITQFHERQENNSQRTRRRRRRQRTTTFLQQSQHVGDYNDSAEDLAFFQESSSSSSSSADSKLIKIRSEIELPFSAKVAYKAYSDLPRQPSWSSWLESVVVIGDNDNDSDDDDDDTNNNQNNNQKQKVESKWTSKVMGIRYSWTAEAVRNIEPHTIQWRSVTGLRNEGIVRFYPLNDKNYDEGPTLMTLQMVFKLPKAVNSIVKRSKRVSKFVQESMIAQSLKDFRDTVMEEDLEKSTSNKKSSTVL
eukprot:CAMPEP_0116134924 /NCGR_PEP_ID=MMETSP0329-20121206/10917_1 /TAXON_ID=697910 /ORGANISM="Pseudo-nitzschia arenysensis, Strain B593" /LENGTH=290 /DNA_ID=CAMNT_0003629691 /DNA_START=139 /DNA_END=1011 /DNA_ORIENTATION=-